MTTPPTPARADPLAMLDDLTDFKPVSSPRAKPAPELVREVSEASNFPSRAAPKPIAAAAASAPAAHRPTRRHRTGRNVQINVKATAETAERLAKLSDKQNWAFGETLARALDALEASLDAKG